MTGDLGRSANALAVSAPEAARLLSISRNKLYNLVKEGHIPLVKIGTRTVFRVSDLKRLIGEVAA